MVATSNSNVVAVVDVVVVVVLIPPLRRQPRKLTASADKREGNHFLRISRWKGGETFFYLSKEFARRTLRTTTFSQLASFLFSWNVVCAVLLLLRFFSFLLILFLFYLNNKKKSRAFCFFWENFLFLLETKQGESIYFISPLLPKFSLVAGEPRIGREIERRRNWRSKRSRTRTHRGFQSVLTVSAMSECLLGATSLFLSLSRFLFLFIRFISFFLLLFIPSFPPLLSSLFLWDARSSRCRS